MIRHRLATAARWVGDVLRPLAHRLHGDLEWRARNGSGIHPPPAPQGMDTSMDAPEDFDG